MTSQADHATEQARIMPIATNNKSYMNSRESKNRGHPPFLGGIGIEIPSLYTSPHSSNTKFSDKNCHMGDKWKFFSVGKLRENLILENFSPT